MSENNDYMPANTRHERPKYRVTAAVFAFLFGWCGFHKFYLGYISTGIVYLLITLLSVCLIFSFFFTLVGVFTIYIPVIFSIVDGMRYLTKTDEEFQDIYVQGRRDWF